MTKNGDRREIPINQTLRGVLSNIPRRLDSPFVFVNEGGKRYGDVKKSFHAACRRAGIKDFRFHDLRHTYTTNARKAGVEMTVIMKLTGHKTLSMFNRYNTVDQEDAVDAMKRLDQFLSSQKSLESSNQFQTGSFLVE